MAETVDHTVDPAQQEGRADEEGAGAGFVPGQAADPTGPSPEAPGQEPEADAEPEAAAEGETAPPCDPGPASAGRPAGPYASVHADTNHGTQIGQWFEAVQRHSGAPLPPKTVERDLEDYVPVENEPELSKLLEDNRALVLFADHPGSGRWTTALRLLTTRPGDALTLRRMRREPGDSFSAEGLKGHKRTGWILDLRAAEESIPASCDFGLELMAAADLHDDDSYLVVVLRTELWNRIGHQAGELARKVKPPTPSVLLTKYLDSAGITGPARWADDHLIKDELAGLRPGQVREWARTLVRAESEYRIATGRSTEPGSDGFNWVIETAGQAVSGWTDVLTEWHSQDGRTSYDRNYLLLAAVCNGEPIDNVHERVLSLARALGERSEASTRLAGQQGPGLIQLAHQIDAELQADGTLSFPGPGFAEAVVRYFLRDRPELIVSFMRWTAQLCVDLPASKAERLAERLAPWLLHHAQAARSTRTLQVVAANWSADRTLAKHAHALLVTAALDPEIGQLTRNATGNWIEKGDSHLLKTLAHVFQSVTPAHPEQMLRRLGDLAGSLDEHAQLNAAQKESVAQAVGAAVDGLWGDDALRPRLRKTLTTWFAGIHKGQRQAAASAFMLLALQRDDTGSPVLVGGSGAIVADWVIRGWRTTLESEEPTALSRRACAAWLDAAVARPHTAEVITSTLVRAVHETAGDHLRGLRFLNLVRLAEHWISQNDTHADEDRKRLHTALMRSVRDADPHSTGSHSEREPTGE
ncbi:hypothetical protein HHL19_18605 [Streptomyces sp. R302]|uniref:hypothetical protein n=1 Tax=unclassified Streptomyces TaxID=2593676 RepID=UPI00145C63B8|nr:MULTISPECIES: hypothetical protein [unclassified Streptomyces]NML54807.1 hypothetical protein [Streptomyces sp. R301]NML80624.1 hypothetical protein [Streptomyces sp. R302]